MASRVIANIPLFNKVDVPIHKTSPKFMISDPAAKRDFYKFTIEQYLTRTNITKCDVCISLQYNDDPLLTEYLDTLRDKVIILDAPEFDYPGPFAAREAVWRMLPDYDYYFTTDMDNVTIANNWVDFLIACFNIHPKTGMLGGRYQKAVACPDHIKDVQFYDINKQAVDPLTLKIDYVTDWSFFPRSTLELFDKHWGHQWVPKGTDYFTAAAVYGELYFGYKIAQLGLEARDLREWCITHFTNITPNHCSNGGITYYQLVSAFTECKNKKIDICPFVNPVIFTIEPQLKLLLPMME